jgi:translation elongation factor EF-Ts
MSPVSDSAHEIPPKVEEKERTILAEQWAGTPINARQKIIAEKLAKWQNEVCLLDQPLIKAQEHSVGPILPNP